MQSIKQVKHSWLGLHAPTLVPVWVCSIRVSVFFLLSCTLDDFRNFFLESGKYVNIYIYLKPGYYGLWYCTV